jgi:uncharacterized protein (DUF1778 family)
VKTPLIGRPPMPAKDRAISRIVLRVQRAEKAAYVRAAQSKGLTLSDWMRDACAAQILRAK